MDEYEYYFFFDCQARALTAYTINYIHQIWSSQIQYGPYPESKGNLRKHFKDTASFIDYFKKKRSYVNLTVLMGSLTETEALRNEIKSKTDIVLCYSFVIPQHDSTSQLQQNVQTHSNQPSDPNIKQILNDVLTGIKDSHEAYYQVIARSLSELNVSIKDIQNRTSQLTSSRNSHKDAEQTAAFDNLSKSISRIENYTKETHYFARELYNNAPNGTNNSDTIISDLREELNKYKNDFYLKTIQPYVCFAIEMVCVMYEDLYNLIQTEGIESPLVERMRRVISASENYIKRMNVQIRTSQIGDAWNPNLMRAYDDRVCTNQEEMKGHVAYSISPAFFWVLPRVNAPGSDNLLLKEEIVALYE